MKHSINLYPDDELMKWIEEKSKAERRSKNNFILMIIDWFKTNSENSEK